MLCVELTGFKEKIIELEELVLEDECKASLEYYKLVTRVLKLVGKHHGVVAGDMESLVLELSWRLGDEGESLRRLWDTANYLYIYGYKDKLLDPESVRRRIKDLEQTYARLLGVLCTWSTLPEDFKYSNK